MGRDMEAKKLYDRNWKRTTLKGKACKRRSLVKYRYGITVAEAASMIVEQAGKCKICKREIDLHIDHDHATGKVRGMLCRGCNTKLGWYEKHRTAIMEYLHDES